MFVTCLTYVCIHSSGYACNAEKLKEFRPSMDFNEKSCQIYKTPCNDCEFSYIGQTKPDLKTRILEHQRITEINNLKNQLSTNTQ